MKSIGISVTFSTAPIVLDIPPFKATQGEGIKMLLILPLITCKCASNNTSEYLLNKIRKIVHLTY